MWLPFPKLLFCVTALAIGSFGCSGSGDDDDDDDDDGGTNVAADFLGHWDPLSNTGTDSCTGEFDGVADYGMELRVGSASDLEFVEYSATEPSKVVCVQRFDVKNGDAVLDGRQTCEYVFPGTDSEGEPIELINAVTYKTVRISLTDEDGLLEIGETEREDMASGDTCTSTYRVSYVRD